MDYLSAAALLLLIFAGPTLLLMVVQAFYGLTPPQIKSPVDHLLLHVIIPLFLIVGLPCWGLVELLLKHGWSWTDLTNHTAFTGFALPLPMPLLAALLAVEGVLMADRVAIDLRHLNINGLHVMLKRVNPVSTMLAAAAAWLGTLEPNFPTLLALTCALLVPFAEAVEKYLKSRPQLARA